MTIRTRLTLWYAVILVASLLVMGLGTYQEIAEQMRRNNHRQSAESALGETGEMVFRIGLPAVILGLAGGLWFMRRALAPVVALTQAAEKLHDRNLTLSLPRTRNGDELDRLAEVLIDLTTRLDGSFQRIREFTLHASHELKTPLTIMHGELETILRDENVATALRERLLSQLDEVQRLSKIVDGLTLLTKADAGLVKLSKKPVRLDELVRDIYADALILGESINVGVEIKQCDELIVFGDPHRLRQLLLNLADNAVKYNQADGSILITLRRDDDSAELTMTNTGPGITPEKIGHVFERFYRGDPAHGNEDGCGLGLSIAQWIISAHNGTIRIESVPMKLTIVTVRIPLSDSSASRTGS